MIVVFVNSRYGEHERFAFIGLNNSEIKRRVVGMSRMGVTGNIYIRSFLVGPCDGLTDGNSDIFGFKAASAIGDRGCPNGGVYTGG